MYIYLSVNSVRPVHVVINELYTYSNIVTMSRGPLAGA